MIYRILILLLIVFKCGAGELPCQQGVILEKFIKLLFEKSEAGYVLFDQKPVCINGYYATDQFSGENEAHKRSVILREGAGVWKELNCTSDKYIIHVYKKKDEMVDYYHVLVINRPLFLKTVDENKALFQYILGPEVNGEKLLDELIDPNATFHGVLKGDKVLIGILLGFGTQNSLYGSRIENIQDMLFGDENLPCKPRLEALGQVRKEFLEMLFYNDFSREIKIEPSFGFASIQEEMKQLSSKMDVSSLALTKDPPFIFGRLKGDETLAKEIEKSQVKIKELLKRSDFLENVLGMMFPNAVIDLDKVVGLNDVSQLPFLVSANMWNIIKDENDTYINAFIEGCLACDKNETVESEFSLFDYRKFKIIEKTKDNLHRADEIFSSLKDNKQYQEMIESKLYYKVLREGLGQEVKKNQRVVVQLVIKDQNNNVLKDTHRGKPIDLDLSDVIPGLAYGMQNMRVKEIREVIIHPSLAYGIHTTMEKGIALKIEIELFETDGVGSELKPIAYANLNLPNAIQWDDLTRSVGRAHGFKTWQHYKKQPFFTFDQVHYHLKAILTNRDEKIDLDSQQDLINRLHWLIYFMERK